MPQRSWPRPRSWWAERRRVHKMNMGRADTGPGGRPEVEPYRFAAEQEEKEVPLKASCPRCGGLTMVDMVRTDIWQGDTMIVVEDIPAHVCDRCAEQFYSELVADTLRGLLQEGLKSALPKREMVVRVYSLEGRVKVPQPPPQMDSRSGLPPEGG